MDVRPSVRMCVRTYIHDPVRLRLRHLYQVEFCSFIVRYPTAGAFVYCRHISSSYCLDLVKMYKVFERVTNFANFAYCKILSFAVRRIDWFLYARLKNIKSS